MRRGFFITFEGGEVAGKSTQAQLLGERLRESGFEVIVTREPGGTRIGEQIRAITHSRENIDLVATSEAYLMAAARAQHVEQIIAPSLISGKIVVCDRYVDSSIAYQGYGRKLGPQIISDLNQLAVDGALPDLTILLDVLPEIGISRQLKSAKAKDRLDLQQQEFYRRVYEGYRKLATEHKNRYVIIDATPASDAVADRVWEVVTKYLEKRETDR
jgi:dTMP kinase